MIVKTGLDLGDFSYSIFNFGEKISSREENNWICKAKQIQKITSIFTQNGNFVHPGHIFSSQLEIYHGIQEPTEANQNT